MRRFNFLLLFCVAFTFSASPKSYKVTNIIEFNQAVKRLQPGDSIVLRNGIWRDVQFRLRANGTKEQRVYLAAETPGKVFIEGQSKLQFSGKHIHISGLVFRNGFTPRSPVIEFRTSSRDYAYHSVLSECVIDTYNNHRDSADHWVGIYGQENRVEYCYFGGKTNVGTTLVIWPNDSNSINNNHQIVHNYFGPRPRLGSNGGETIRIGTSQVCHLNSGSTVAFNFFERCNGEVEIISNKSGGNRFLNNTFFECEGNLVLRHGDNAVVAGNWFIGNGKAFTGGVRIINEGHLVYNNYFYKLRGEDFRAPLVIMNAIPNSPANGYAAVRNVLVANNTFVDCSVPFAFGVGAGTRNRTVIPESTIIKNNVVYSPQETDLIKAFDNTSGIQLYHNLMVSRSGTYLNNNSTSGELHRGSMFGINYIASTIKARELDFLQHDIVGIDRETPVIGAFQSSNVPPVIEIATAKNTGPRWYKPAHRMESSNLQTTHRIRPGTDLLTQAIAQAKEGDVIELLEGLHVVTRTALLKKDVIIRTAPGFKNRATIRMDAQLAHEALFEIEGNPTIRFQNVILTGKSKTTFPVKYAIVTSSHWASGYNLFFDGCKIIDFNESKGAVFLAKKGTIADTIKATNSTFKNVNRGFVLSSETDNVGKYSAEHVQFENCVFSHITHYALDYFRGGLDESTIGGVLYVDHCVFHRVGQHDTPYILNTNGIVFVTIRNTIFHQSGAKVPVHLTGRKQRITHSNFFECSLPTIENNAYSKGLMQHNPRFARNSFLLSRRSALIGKGDEGRNIGLK